MNLVCVLFLLAITSIEVVFSEENEENTKHIICYYGTWATYRPGDGQFNVEHINPHLCTHLVYAFVGIDDEGYVIYLDPFLDLPDEWGRDNIAKFNALKQKNPKLKTLFAVGGWGEGSAKYSVMAADPILRHNFVTSALAMTLRHSFDGFDLDWEYPNQRDTVHGEADIDNFTQLIRELKAVFGPHGLMVTAAVAATKDKAAASYDIPAICELLDLVGLMTYDMHGAWDNVTGHNAALHKGEEDGGTPSEELYTVDVSVEYWLAQGCPPEKLIMGLPMYARSFNLTDPNVNGVRAPSNGDGIVGPFTNTDGFLGYNEFCDMLRTETWEIQYDSLAKVPYAVQGHNWISYDDADSLTEKIKWGLQRNISGVMIWSIETDDFLGKCGTKYVLLEGINAAIKTEDEKKETEEDTQEEEEDEEEQDEEEEEEEEEGEEEEDDDEEKVEETEEDTEEGEDEEGEEEEDDDEEKVEETEEDTEEGEEEEDDDGEKVEETEEDTEEVKEEDKETEENTEEKSEEVKEEDNGISAIKASQTVLMSAVMLIMLKHI